VGEQKAVMQLGYYGDCQILSEIKFNCSNKGNQTLLYPNVMYIRRASIALCADYQHNLNHATHVVDSTTAESADSLLCLLCARSLTPL
jgi:hypothetical protein